MSDIADQSAFSTEPVSQSEAASEVSTPESDGALYEQFLYHLAQTAASVGTDIIPTAIAAFLEDYGTAIDQRVGSALAEWKVQLLQEKANRENEAQAQADRLARAKRFISQGLDQAWHARKLIHDHPDHPMRALDSTTFDITVSLEAAEELTDPKS